jgi:uncharacterized protein YcfL
VTHFLVEVPIIETFKKVKRIDCNMKKLLIGLVLLVVLIVACSPKQEIAQPDGQEVQNGVEGSEAVEALVEDLSTEDTDDVASELEELEW